MKILQITLGFLPAVHWGGPVQVINQNSLELIKRGHQVTVCCSNLYDKHSKIKPDTFEQSINGIRVIYFNSLNFPWWPGTLGPIYYRGFSRWLKKEISSFDVVHLHGYRSLMNFPAIYWAKMSKKPIIMQPHGSLPVIINTIRIKRLYDKLLGSYELRYLSGVIALQECEYKQALNIGIQPERIHIIPNGMDISIKNEFPPINTFREKYSIPTTRPIILFMARINRKKGADMLVSSFAQIDPKLDAHLVIVGPDDGQLNEVNSLIHRYHLEDRVTLTGLLTRNDVWEAYLNAKLFVLPCRTDTFPVTIIEACLAEVPMIITEGCEIAHIVTGKVADITPFNSTAFAKAIESLLKEPSKYEKYQRNCEILMKQSFSVQNTVDGLENLYEKVIAEKRPGYCKGIII